jgi:hypothetical protein
MQAHSSNSLVIETIDVLHIAETVKPTRPVSPAQATSHATKLLVVWACVALAYGLMSYGRIFEEYLQW